MQDQLVLSHVEVESRDFVRRVYNWMAGGLAVTGLVSWYMASNSSMILGLVKTPGLLIGLLIVEFVLVAALSGWVSRMSVSTASLAFLFYSALNGVTISTLFLVYTTASIAATFFVTAGTFGAMALYGQTTKTDLTSMGNLCFMALIGIILASVANFWLHSPAMNAIVAYAGVLIFVGLTAYDAQRIKNFNVPADEGTELETKEAILGALALYLDFINLFLSLIRIMGKRRD